jgi:hypothetical protein
VPVPLMQPSFSSVPVGPSISRLPHPAGSVVEGTFTKTTCPAWPVKCRASVPPALVIRTVVDGPPIAKPPAFWVGCGDWSGCEGAVDAVVCEGSDACVVASAAAKSGWPVRPTSSSQSCSAAWSVIPAAAHAASAWARSGTWLVVAGACGKERSVYVAVLVPAA